MRRSRRLEDLGLFDIIVDESPQLFIHNAFADAFYVDDALGDVLLSGEPWCNLDFDVFEADWQ